MVSTFEEKERLQILLQCGILDSEINEADYTSITSTATQLLKIPMASVTMIASDRLWFKSTHGFSSVELPRKGTFSDHVSDLNDPTDMFVILDTHQSEKFREYSQVKDSPHVRFYAGTPIAVEGHIVGSLCVYDVQPRKRLSVTDRMNLLDLAHATSILLTERRNRLISQTSAVDRLVSHLLHDSLSIPLQEMSSALSVLAPNNASNISSGRTSRTPSMDSIHSVEKGVSELLLTQSRSLLEHTDDLEEAPSSNCMVSATALNVANMEQTNGTLNHSSSESLQDIFVALCQLNSLIGNRSSNQNSPRSLTDSEHIVAQKDWISSPDERIQVPLRYTQSPNSCEYLDDINEEVNETPSLRFQNIRFGSLRASGSSSTLKNTDESDSIRLSQRLPGFSTFVYSNLSSDLNDMLSYLQQVLPVSVSNFRTAWNISLPTEIFQNPQCSQVKCVIHLMDVLTNILETIMTHIIMRTKQLEVTVTMNILSTKNDIQQEFQPNDSRGYLLQDNAILPAELLLSMKAIDYMNTFYGGHVTVEPKVDHTFTLQTERHEQIESQTSDENHVIPYDFFIDNVAIQEILSPLGVRTMWKLQENTTNTESSQIAGNPPLTRVFDITSGMLQYDLVVPCRLEMTYLPPEEIEKITVTDTKISTRLEEKASSPLPNLPQTTTVSAESKSNEEISSPVIPFNNSVAEPTIPSPLAPKTKLHVLVVDDSPAIQKILGKWLQRNDCEVTSALNGLLGVEALQKSQPIFDLVFMDFLMPVMDGLEAVRTFYQWKAEISPEIAAKYDQTLIIGLSATANVEEQQEGLKVGMNYFIQKPADTKLLRIIIDWKLQQQDIQEISKKLLAGVSL